MLLAILPLLFSRISVLGAPGSWTDAQEIITPNKQFSAITKVPVVLGVMSQCPDALLCESVFDDVLKVVAEKVDVSLTFLGKINSSEPDFGVTCLHGPGECAGNVQELCAIKYTPLSTWWKFVQCQNALGRYEVGKPEVALKCAKEVDLDWEFSGVGGCVGLDGSGKGEEGVKLLQESVTFSKELGIQ
jgi:hypothetical protein